MRALVLSCIVLPMVATAEPVWSATARQEDVRTQRLAGARALAQSIARRERSLAARSADDVAAEVVARLLDMGLIGTVDPSLVAELLTERAALELERDRCAVGWRAGAGCADARRSLELLEDRFHSVTGVTARDFKSGWRLAERHTPAAAAGVSAGSMNQTCLCNVDVYSVRRWMEPWWGLECNDHGGHGVCSNDVDSFFHSFGCGAMTGWVGIFNDGYVVSGRECPDDHYTCFHGPSRCDGGGSWGSVCSCDTLHAQLGDPGGAGYGGYLEDGLAVLQLRASSVQLSDACGEGWISVRNFVTENDKVCCDDPMGTLMAWLPTVEGSASRYTEATVQNCNGGSQSGQPPYCGRFGATYRVDTFCQTLGEPCSDPCCGDPCCGDPCCGDPCCENPCLCEVCFE